MLSVRLGLDSPRRGMTRYDTFTALAPLHGGFYVASLSVSLRLVLVNNSGIPWLPNPLPVNPTLSDLQFYIFFRALCVPHYVSADRSNRSKIRPRRKMAIPASIARTILAVTDATAIATNV